MTPFHIEILSPQGNEPFFTATRGWSFFGFAPTEVYCSDRMVGSFCPTRKRKMGYFGSFAFHDEDGNPLFNYLGELCYEGPEGSKVGAAYKSGDEDLMTLYRVNKTWKVYGYHSQIFLTAYRKLACYLHAIKAWPTKSLSLNL
jgi:hypothetical protein